MSIQELFLKEKPISMLVPPTPGRVEIWTDAVGGPELFRFLDHQELSKEELLMVEYLLQHRGFQLLVKLMFHENTPEEGTEYMSLGKEMYKHWADVHPM